MGVHEDAAGFSDLGDAQERRDDTGGAQTLPAGTAPVHEPVTQIAGVLNPGWPDESHGDHVSVNHQDLNSYDYSNSQGEPSPSRSTLYHAPPGFGAAGSISSTSHAVESPTARWLGLLIGDAILDNNGALPDIELDYSGVDAIGDVGTTRTPASDAPQDPSSSLVASREGQAIEGNQDSHLARPKSRHPSLQERLPQLESDQLLEKRAWHSSEPIRLSPLERMLFHHFVQHVSTWVSPP